MYKPEDFAWLAEKRYNKYSQFGEDGILEAIFARIGTANRWCCECGAADGIFFSNSRKLIEEGWSALLIEADDDLFEKLFNLYLREERVQTSCLLVSAIGEQTFDWLLERDHAPLDLDLLVIDVDGQDYWLFNSLLKYRPRVVMVEYDPTSDKEYIPPIGEPGQAGLHAIINLGIGKYYWPVAITSTNVIFVQQELCSRLVGSTVVLSVKKSQQGETEDLLLTPRRDPIETEDLLLTPRHGSKLAGEAQIIGVPWSEFRKDGEKYHGEVDSHLHESESGSPKCVHCGLPGVWPLVGKSIASKTPESANVWDCGHGQNVAWKVAANGCECCGRNDVPMALGVPVFCEKCKPASTEEKPPRVALVMSTGRLGFLGTMDCVIQSVHSLPITWLRGEGVFWSQTLSRGISRAIKAGADYIITADHDTVFEHAHTDNAMAKLVCLMYDNPDVDVIIAAQMKREGGPLLATSDQEIRLLDPLVRVTRGHFGLTIFRPSVFERLSKPWFYEKPNEDGDWEENRIDADIGFWKNCEENGINVRMSLDVLIGHIELVVTWPGQNLETVYQPMQDWRDNGKPPEAFDRQRVIAAVKANPALLYGPKLEMGG